MKMDFDTTFDDFYHKVRNEITEMNKKIEYLENIIELKNEHIKDLKRIIED